MVKVKSLNGTKWLSKHFLWASNCTASPAAAWSKWSVARELRRSPWGSLRCSRSTSPTNRLCNPGVEAEPPKTCVGARSLHHVISINGRFTYSTSQESTGAKKNNVCQIHHLISQVSSIWSCSLSKTINSTTFRNNRTQNSTTQSPNGRSHGSRKWWNRKAVVWSNAVPPLKAVARVAINIRASNKKSTAARQMAHQNTTSRKFLSCCTSNTHLPTEVPEGPGLSERKEAEETAGMVERSGWFWCLKLFHIHVTCCTCRWLNGSCHYKT